ncbi:xanthine dehydrogenase family protein subunit M [Bacillus sp. S/N-304-OC-R1]|uniref:FAD binding domain-containing protein n=1 Tax=Bacillus sp. S/N-304-OC-R1 TaxID=2758034 RepID=UPI001C8F12AD|nr:FAD binding domain-containing protein [Bacillus sp. S/N-304-OC-R1]MBY0120431.1 FAD binding domain-containing protein [Bacillus sp. S/N-304-OC-R1]
MIISESEYYKPESLDEATKLFYQLSQNDIHPMYYSGGTEIITLRRLNLINPNAVIDIKGIPECNTYEFNKDFLIMGSAIPLTLLEEINYFPMLTKTAKGVADHTARNKITLGGNICGQIFYREAVLPFLLTDSYIITAGFDGIKTVPIHSIFDQKMNLMEGQLLVQLATEKRYLEMPHLVIKKRQQWETGYPLITFAAMKADDGIRIAFSGLCPFPFRSPEVEKELNNRQLPFEERINQAIFHLPNPILDDVEGSKEYRMFVFKNTVLDILIELEGL